MTASPALRSAVSRSGHASAVATALLACCALLSTVRADDGAQKTFPTAHAAARALAAAAKADDIPALLQIFGPTGKDLVESGDDVADKTARTHFAAAYEARHTMRNVSTGRFILEVGKADWPVPVPIVKKDGHWMFDSASGLQEVLYRRVGRNELAAIRVCHALIDAEREYALAGHDGNPSGAYTKRLVSEPGTQNGLYWPVKEDEPASPAGPFVAHASANGYDVLEGKPTPFYGYFFRVLTAQGPHAHRGARDYMVDGRLTAGVALLAYPAEYRNSGVMTFIISRHGTLYQKDLGPDTEAAAKAITAYDPDPSWAKVAE
ncbi:MAG: DUF2950 domain-containing protein [Nevskia sp.]|nr:DUF2950 domain-containing protein [Nevskia sp.]